MKVKNLIKILSAFPQDYEVYIPEIFDNRRALYGHYFEGATSLDEREISIEEAQDAVCLGCSVSETIDILTSRREKRETKGKP